VPLDPLVRMARVLEKKSCDRRSEDTTSRDNKLTPLSDKGEILARSRCCERVGWEDLHAKGGQQQRGSGRGARGL
jgi:hypothetical protein